MRLPRSVRNTTAIRSVCTRILPPALRVGIRQSRRAWRIDNQAALAKSVARREESRIANCLLEPPAILRSSLEVSSKILRTRHLVVTRFFCAHTSWGIDKASAASLHPEVRRRV